MNCKQGDLAIVVRSNLGNLGKIVRVLKPYRKGYSRNDGTTYPNLNLADIDAWIVECDSGVWVERVSGSIVSLTMHAFRDSSLRPIRDQPGDDETLEWAGLPNNLGVAA